MAWFTPPYADGSLGITHTDEGAIKWLSKKDCNTLLDVGCSTGGQVALAIKNGWKAFGLEVDPRVINGQANVALINCCVNPVIFHHPFDVVWSVEVAEHIPAMYEYKYLTTLVENCGKYLILTASQKEENMPLHVNCKPLDYWIEKIEGMGMKYNGKLYKDLLKNSTMKREFLEETGMMFEQIALVTIVGTLAGFGYTGATYINRLENLEAKIGGLGEAVDAQQAIEERFAGIETSVDYINKSIDEGIDVSLKAHAESINLLGSQLEGLSVAVKNLEKDVEKLEDGDKNPLAN